MTAKKIWITATALAIVTLTAGLAVPASSPRTADALSIAVPRADVLDSVAVTVTLDPDDATGTVSFVAAGAARGAKRLGSGESTSFGPVRLPYGTHELKALLQTADGMSYSEPVTVRVWQQPVPPVLVSPRGSWVAKRAPIVVKAGPGTATIRLRLNGRTIKTVSAKPGAVVNLGTVEFAKGTNRIELTASNPVASATGTFSIRRLEYPWATCIIIDKSDFRLYWIKNGTLVKSYPIAHGKRSTPTPSRVWRIDAKYRTDPRGVYGPRKMRLFKKVGSSYVYTAYGIHGTNQPWVIGTMASHGCIRMYNRDILELWPQVPLRTMVLTRD